MSKRRTTIEWNDVSSQVLLKGGDNFAYCEKQFFKSLKLRNLSERTAAFYQENLIVIRRALTELKSDDKPVTITYNDLQDVLHYCMEELNNSPGTINHRISTMKQFFKFLNEEEYIATNPAEKLSKQKTKQVKINPFTETEIKALLNAPDKNTFVGYRDFVIMMLSLDTGMRLSELTNFRLHDISFENNEIFISKGKGNKERTVYFQNKMKEHLKRYLKIRGEINHDYLFIGRSDNPLSNKAIQDRLTLYGNIAQINKRVSPHTFRHTFAKFYITNGGDAFSLQQILGHTSTEMTRKYVQLFGTDLRQMHRKFSPVEGMLLR